MTKHILFILARWYAVTTTTSYPHICSCLFYTHHLHLKGSQQELGRTEEFAHCLLRTKVILPPFKAVRPHCHFYFTPLVGVSTTMPHADNIPFSLIHTHPLTDTG